MNNINILGKKRQEQRLPAAETMRLVLQTYLDNMKFAYECPTTFGQTGFLLSRVIPRCTDPNKNIRKVNFTNYYESDDTFFFNTGSRRVSMPHPLYSGALRGPNARPRQGVK